jgi:hypothetical protein
VDLDTHHPWFERRRWNLGKFDFAEPTWPPDHDFAQSLSLRRRLTKPQARL